MRLSFSPLRAAFLSLTLAGFSAATPAHANFLINPAGGTSLTGFAAGGPADPNDGSLQRSLGGSFSFYGTSLTSIYVQVDGFLSVEDGYDYFIDRSVAALASADPTTPGPVIAPYYDDLILRAGTSTISERVVAGSYYSVTYNINGIGDVTAANTAQFQTVLFTGSTVINGTQFLAGDIVFSYGNSTNTVAGSNFSVGVAQNATNATNAFNASGGQFASNASFLSNFNNANQALLFRFAVPVTGGQGTYTQSLIPLGVGAAAPEPGTLALLGAGVLPLAGLIARRRKSETA